MCCKLFHFLWSFKPMILLFYALYSSINDCLDKLVYGNAKATEDNRYGCDSWDSYWDQPWCNPNILADQWDCSSGTDGEINRAKIWVICSETDQGDIVKIVGYILVALSSFYALCVLLYAFIKAPKFRTLEYYAHIVMIKRAKYFKVFLRFMYVIIILVMLLFLVLLFWYYAVSDYFLPEVIGSIFSTLILSGLSVSELRKTNEINFKYEIPDENDKDFSKPIYLSSRCCSCITAEDFFERLEEAVLVYSVTGNNTLLKSCLKEDTDEECKRVLAYYTHIFESQQAEMEQAAEKLTKKSMELQTVINTAASTVDVISNES